MENLKQIEITSLRNKCENEAMAQIQNLKRSQYGNQEIHELNIRSLKDQIGKKNFEIEDIKRDSKLDAEKLQNEVLLRLTLDQLPEERVEESVTAKRALTGLVEN